MASRLMNAPREVASGLLAIQPCAAYLEGGGGRCVYHNLSVARPCDMAGGRYEAVLVINQAEELAVGHPAPNMKGSVPG